MRTSTSSMAMASANTDLSKPMNTRNRLQTKVGRFRGGKMMPAAAVRVRPGEGGRVSQNVVMELDPIAGRMVTDVTGHLYTVFVPNQAIDAIKDPAAQYAGMSEVFRQKMLAGTPYFALENETEISKRLGLEPIKIGGVLKINQAARLAYNCAVNYLRQRLYVNAALLPHTNAAMAPAILGQTVLDRLNAVLDPDDRINGNVNLELPTVNLPVRNLFVQPTETSGSVKNVQDAGTLGTTTARDVRALWADRGIDATTVDPIYALFDGVQASGLSLTDFYNAERIDKLTRVIGKMIEDNPEYGQEMALRWAYGLTLDNDKVPYLVAERSAIFGRALQMATDSAGINAETMRSDLTLSMSYTVPIPRTELGGILVTILVVKPDETLAGQPDPDFAEEFTADNYAADMLQIDPVPVLMRELDNTVATGSEATVALYVGHNGLKRAYVNYGLNRQIDPTTVENKTSIWQLEIPASVTPASVLYPADLDHYPFADQLAEVVTYSITTAATFATPMVFGPTPVERLAILTDENVLGDA